MIRLDKHRFKNGVIKTQVRIVDGYRDENNKPKQRTVKNYGYLEDRENPEEFLASLRETDKIRKQEKRITVNTVPTLPFYEDKGSDLYLFGHKYLEAVYNELHLEKAFNYAGRAYNPNDIFRSFVIGRILNPELKKGACKTAEALYGKNFVLSPDQVYESLNIFAGLFDEIQQQVNKEIRSLTGRDTSRIYFYSSNYRFKTDLTKENTGNPMVKIGLLTDNDGIPVCMRVFPGTTPDSLTMLPVLREAKTSYGVEKTVVTADERMNTPENVDFIVNNGDGYIFAQSLKGEDGRRYRERVSDEKVFTVVNENYRYQTFVENYVGKDKNGNDATRQRRVYIYFDGVAETGKKSYDNGGEKIKGNEKYDTLSAVITSELNHDGQKIFESYRELLKIGDLLKTCSDGPGLRPAHAFNENPVKAHFIISFVSLCVLLILQKKMNYSINIKRMVRALNMCKCTEMVNGIIHVIKDDSCRQLFNPESDNTRTGYISEESDKNTEDMAEDFKLILKEFDSSVCTSLLKKADFENFLKSIKLKK